MCVWISGKLSEISSSAYSFDPNGILEKEKRNLCVSLIIPYKTIT
jgi:hypothetical protein